MLARDYPKLASSTARCLEVVGERWTLLVVRDVFSGNRRFEEMQRSLGVARNVLSARLQGLVDEGILERRPYSEHPPRHEYFLTEKGLDLWPVLVALMAWGDKYSPRPGGAPIVLEHKGCGGRMNDRRICERCGQHLTVREARAVPGPGAKDAEAEVDAKRGSAVA
jgi:DNA-binding HxlR family transcriptional regulator